MTSQRTPFHIPHPSTRPSSLRSQPSLDIAAVLSRAGAFEDLELLATSPSFTESSPDDECNLEDVPPFPKDHRPAIFIIQDHRAQVPFAVRPGVISLGDIHADEQTARNVISAPTIPRMNLVMKEQLFMKTWVEKLTPQRPPRHVPWTSDKPVPRRKWISEGSIFPAETIHSWTSKIKPPGMARPFANCLSNVTTLHSVHSIRDDTDSAVILKECPGRQAGSKLSIHAFESGPSVPIHGRKQKRAQRASDSPIPKPCSNKTTKQLVPTCGDASLPLPQLGSIPSLAVRRGKKVSGLQLKDVDDLKYPDLPTPFRSPTVWSPKFGLGILSPDEEPFTDHQSMLSNLRSQYAALASGTSTTYEIKEWQAASMDSDMYSVTSKPSSLSDDEWAFEKDLVVVTEDLQGADNTPGVLPPSFMPNIVPDRPRNSLDDRCSSCISSARSALPPRSRSADMKVSPASSNDLPRVTATSTPPCARSILKTAKSVRFEDVRRSQDAGLLVPSAKESSTAARRPSPLRNSFTAPLSAADANMSGAKAGPKPKGDQVPVIMKSKLVPRIRLYRVSEVPILRRVDTNVRHEVPSAPGLDKPTTSTIGRHSHVAGADKENGRTTPAHARKPWSTTNENNLRISVDDRYRNRLTPLRNIFKFN